MTDQPVTIPPFTVKFSNMKFRRESLGGVDMNTQRSNFLSEETNFLMDSIAEWMSSVLEKPVDHDLATSLEDGIDLCCLFMKCFPNASLNNWHKDVSKFAIYKRDNVWAFIDGCKKIGIPSNSIIDYTYFESKNNSRIVGCMLMFIKTVFEQNGLAVTTETKKHKTAIGRISDIFLADNKEETFDPSFLSDLSDIDIELELDIHLSTSNGEIPPEVADLSPIKSPQAESEKAVQHDTLPPVSYTQEDEEDDVIPLDDDEVVIGPPPISNKSITNLEDDEDIPMPLSALPDTDNEDAIGDRPGLVAVEEPSESAPPVPTEPAPAPAPPAPTEPAPAPPALTEPAPAPPAPTEPAPAPAPPVPTEPAPAPPAEPAPVEPVEAEEQQEEEEVEEISGGWGLFSCCCPRRKLVQHN